MNIPQHMPTIPRGAAQWAKQANATSRLAPQGCNALEWLGCAATVAACAGLSGPGLIACVAAAAPGCVKCVS